MQFALRAMLHARQRRTPTACKHASGSAQLHHFPDEPYAELWGVKCAAEGKAVVMNRLRPRWVAFLIFLSLLFLRIDAAAQCALFDFENATVRSPLPIILTVGGITAQFSATGQGFAIRTANTMGFAPPGFSGLCVYPSSTNAAGLMVAFPSSRLYNPCACLGTRVSLLHVWRFFINDWPTEIQCAHPLHCVRRRCVLSSSGDTSLQPPAIAIHPKGLFLSEPVRVHVPFYERALHEKVFASSCGYAGRVHRGHAGARCRRVGRYRLCQSSCHGREQRDVLEQRIRICG